MMTSREVLKLMLESSDASDLGQPTPLDTVDPMTLDILMARLDKCVSLHQVPTREDQEKLVAYNISQRNYFMANQAEILQSGRKTRSATKPSGPSPRLADLLKDL